MDLLLRCVSSTAILLFALSITSCNDGTPPDSGKVVFTVNMTPGLGSDDAAMNDLDQLNELFQSGTIEWHYSEGQEVMLHKFTLMGEPFTMRDHLNKVGGIQTVLVDYLGEKIAFRKEDAEYRSARELIGSNFSYIINRDDRKELLGCDCVGFEGYFESEQQIINYSGYLCEDLEMMASFMQGLDFNPIEGALFEVNVDLGMAQIQYKANSIEESYDQSVFDYQIEDYTILPASQLNPGNAFMPSLR